MRSKLLEWINFVFHRTCGADENPVGFQQAAMEDGRMVTGFNTDIKLDDVVYHVQTEHRKDAGIETAVYVRGAVIHKLKTSYQDLLDSSDFSEEQVNSRVEAQHRQVVSGIRAGEIKAPAPANPAAS